MGDINMMVIKGTVGQFESRKVGNSTLIKFSVATKKSWKNQSTQQFQESTTWINCTFWASDKQEERLRDPGKGILGKGAVVYVEGEFKTDSWDDKDNPGKKKYSSGCNVENVRVLRSAKEEPQQHQPTSDGQTASQRDFPEAPMAEEDLPF